MSIIQLFSSMTAEQAASMLRDDLNSFVRSELERAFNEALEGEIEDFLLAASSPNGEKIYRNGYYERVLNTSYGPLSLRVPRDRVSLFKTEMLRPYQRTTSDLEYLALPGGTDPERDKRPSPRRFLRRALQGVGEEARRQTGGEGRGIQKPKPPRMRRRVHGRDVRTPEEKLRRILVRLQGMHRWRSG